ncbi:hypothetical protein GGTG_04694 [Gaeumannomyces tritici R3-111a-1]|uniref:Pre-mRNA-splicing factor 38B n=1 Tax=Gaeumannomyces tritici (strain R3-111a-1) TaxID=644352 RepID=J3NTU5_GAET3|nr:hypothetical protein GGTG_04694 [Gaeumannomyces tritici R3-111a-1]EJT79610.1 hypothetical protein GGTG_04694 [Gaeumannomyces tritici R3-111a-1]
MSKHGFLLTDDAVAERLISEANDDSRRARPENKPKPNTRFLRNIIRTTENHNAALLAKEAAESRARLQELRETELRLRERRRHRPEPHEVRRRQMRDISAILHGGGCGSNKARRRASSSHGRGRERDHGRERRRSCSPDGGGQGHGRRYRRERSPLGGDDGEIHDRRHGRERSPLGGDDDDGETHDRRQGLPPSLLARGLGSLPPSLPARGRGNTAPASGIDARFSESYDPTSDKGGGWDDMAEAFRDRQKWKAQGAERLRAAGFTETQIQKWERGAGTGRGDGGDAHADDFCWSKKGELRQWDRGKTVNPDGSVSTGPDWAK